MEENDGGKDPHRIAMSEPPISDAARTPVSSETGPQRTGGVSACVQMVDALQDEKVMLNLTGSCAPSSSSLSKGDLPNHRDQSRQNPLAGSARPTKSRRNSVTIFRHLEPRMAVEYRVELDVYNGPLDLLLYLIKRDELDIYDIPIARITDTYMQYVEHAARMMQARTGWTSTSPAISW